MLYFSEKNLRGNHAGTKARNDIENILCELDCRPANSKQLVLKSNEKEEIIGSIKHRFNYIHYFWDILNVRNEVIFFQYPILSFDIQEKYINFLKKHNKIIFLVHDVHGLKRKNKEEIKEEIRFLNLADGVILHNEFMEKKLLDCGLEIKNIVNLKIFDYLTNETLNKNRLQGNGVIFAGNLDKTKFFKDFCLTNKNIELELFGPNFDEILLDFTNLHYNGSVNPDLLPSRLKGKFGLVWDGDSIDTCNGIFGEYTRYNNPHKLSLYVASGFPVIVWNESAISKFVLDNNIGIAVASLSNLDQYMNSITEDEYDTMVQNVENLREKLIIGFHFKQALQALLEEIKG